MKQIGKYEILGELGQGGMGTVYKGRDTVIGRDVAIKVIHERALNAPTIKARFYREARSAGRLSHENITTIYDVGEEDGAPFLVMEYLDGDDLRHMLDARVALTNEDKLNLAAQICQGLHYAHEQGIIHRDVKPGNIRVLPNGRVKIMDFGIARIQNETQGLTQTNLSLGTPRYMSPEQVRGEALDRRADIFAFGVLFYELLTGDNPFAGDHLTTVIYKIIHEDPPPLTIEPARLATALQPILLKCLAKDREERYPDFQAVHHDLVLVRRNRDDTVALPASAVSDETVLLTRPAVPPRSPRHASVATAAGERRPKTSKNVRWAALGLVLILSVAGISYAFFGSSQAPPEPNLLSEASREHGTPAEGTDPASTDHTSADSLTDTAVLPAPDPDTVDDPPETPPANRQDATEEPQRTPAEETSTPPAERTAPPPAQQANPETPSDTATPTTTDPQPASTGNQTDADRARTAARDAKARVQAALHDTTPYQRALILENEGDQAYADRAYDRAATRFEEAQASFDEAAATSTLEVSAQTAVHTLAQRMKTSIEQKNSAVMVDVFYRDWSDFFKGADEIQAVVRPGNVSVTGTQAQVDVRVEISYRNNRNQKKDAVASYTWILDYQENDDAWVITRVPSN